MEIKKAVILAAGLASRMMPATKSVSKPMLPVVDRPTIHYCVEELVHSGIRDIAIVINGHDLQVENYFTKNEKLNRFVKACGKAELLPMFRQIETLANFSFFKQGKPMGPGHALLQAKKFLGKKPFLLVYSDDLILSKTPACRQLIESYEKCGQNVVAVAELPPKEIPHFGVIKPKNPHNLENPIKVEQIVEKPRLEDAPSNLAVVGRYLLMPDVFEILEKEKAGLGKELYVTNKLQAFASEGRLFAHKLEGQWLTTGKKIDYVKAVVTFALQHKDMGEELRAYLRELVG